MNLRYHILGVATVFALVLVVFVTIFEDYSERRSSDRPWSGARTAPAAPTSPPVAQKTANSDVDDSEWEEF